jgi:hypothetical protein
MSLTAGQGDEIFLDMVFQYQSLQGRIAYARGRARAASDAFWYRCDPLFGTHTCPLAVPGLYITRAEIG